MCRRRYKSYISYGSGWANACSTPFRFYKHYTHEGGVRTPFIVHWPAGLAAHGLAPGPGAITDFMPTICDIAGAAYPANVLPQEGVTLAGVFKGEAMPTRRIFIEHEGNRSVRDGDWKLVALHDKAWELYRIAADPTEMRNLAAQEPARVAELSTAWNEWAERCSVTEKRAVKQQTVETPEIANKPLNIRCDVETEARDGVILAQGGNQHGYALHLKDGRLVFTVRISGKATSISGGVAGGNFTIAAEFKAGGVMTLAVNGKQVAEGNAGGLIAKQPQDELTIGEDAKSAVGDYEAPHPLKGSVTNVEITTP